LKLIEYRNLAQTSIELTWIQALLTELHVSFNTHVLYCDNLSVVVSFAHNPVSFNTHVLYCDNQSVVVSIAHNRVFHNRAKHMKIDVFFVREKVLAKQLSYFIFGLVGRCFNQVTFFSKILGSKGQTQCEQILL